MKVFCYFWPIKKYLKYLLLLFFVIPRVGFSQDPAYYTIGEKEFANLDIYGLLYDESTDVMFIATNSGIYAYKQNNFILIKGHKNQIGNSFFDLDQNDKGEIFCSNLSGQIFQIKENALKIIYEPKGGQGKFINYELLPNNKIAIVFYEALIFQNEDGSFTAKYNIENQLAVDGDTIHLFYAFSYLDSKVYIHGISKGHNHFIVLDESFKLLSSKKEIRNSQTINRIVKQDDVVYGIRNDGSVLGNGASLFENFELQEKERIFSLNDSTVIGLNSQKGFRYLSLNAGKDTLSATPTFFDEIFISAHAQLENGTLLFGTFGEGIIVVSNPLIVKSEHKELFLGIATSPDNEVRISCRSGEIFEIKENRLNLVDKVPHNVDNVYYIPDLDFFKKLGYEDFVYNDSRKTFYHSIDINAVDSSFVFSSDKNGLICDYWNKTKIKNIFFKSSQIQKLKHLFQASRTTSSVWNPKDSLLYIGTSTGLLYRRLEDSIVSELRFNNQHLEVNDLFFSNEKLLCATEKNGLLIFKNNKLLFQLTENEGLLSNTVNQAELKGDVIYLVTKNGLQLYNLKTNEFIGLGLMEGVEPEKITKFALSNDRLWLIEKHSFLSLEIDKIVNHTNEQQIAKLYFDSLLVNGHVIDYSSKTEFGFDQNAFTFYFDYRNLITKSETQIEYALLGFYDDWKAIPSTQNIVEFQSLPVGKYTFLLKASYRNQETETFSYSFEILPPFWQRWWFYVLIGVVGAGSIALIAVYRIRKLRKKTKEELLKKGMEQDAINAQLKAIKTQMNPHFIFNSINSIQDLVLQKETLKSYDYLVEFSKMVRTILDFSEREFIPLEEEIDFLDTYLGLEKLRFQDDFDFEIIVETNSKSVLIPSLIIQPFAENAIKHGLLHKEGPKKLKISFKHKGNTIVCIVEDNGIGIEEAQKIKYRQSNSHKSFSTDAIKKRLQLLEVQTNSKAHYEIENQVDSEGIVQGTKVVIILPVKH